MMWEDMTTWAAIGNLFVQAIQNPVVVLSVVVSVYNAIIDPTTKGIGDSVQALTYTRPN
jgi:phi LC3 family holin